MNKEQIDALTAALDEQHSIISPFYAELMGRFGSLVLEDSISLEKLQQGTEREEANRQLVDEFISILPTVTSVPNRDTYDHLRGYTDTFMSHTAQEAKLLQAFVLWGWSVHGDYNMADSAYFVIGHKRESHKKAGDPDMSMLLVRPVIDKDGHYPILKAETFKKVYDGIRANIDSTLITSYTDKQLKQMYAKETKKLEINRRQSPGSAVFNDTYMPKKNPKNLIDRMGLLRDGSNLPIAFRGTVGALSDENLVEYDVFNHVGELATVFGKQDELKDLLSKSIVDLKDPLEARLEEIKNQTN